MSKREKLIKNDYPCTKMAGGLIFYEDIKSVAEDHRGWIAGKYVKEMSDIPFEVKFSSHQAGEARDEWSLPEEGVTYVTILSGYQKQFFLVEDKEVVVEAKAGQAFFYPNNIPHRWENLEDGTTVITVRTKS